MLAQQLVKISRRFIGRVKSTSQDLDHFSHTSGSGVHVNLVYNIIAFYYHNVVIYVNIHLE